MPSNEPRDPYDGLDGLHVVRESPQSAAARADAEARLAVLRAEYEKLIAGESAGLEVHGLLRPEDLLPGGFADRLKTSAMIPMSFGFTTAGEAELARQALQPKLGERIRDRWLCLRWALATWILGFDPDEANR